MARIAIPPGEHLTEELKALHMSAAELARQLRNLSTGMRHEVREFTVAGSA